MKNLLLLMMSFAFLMTFNQCAKEGEIGPEGLQGLQGVQGEKGEKGDKGDKGDKGADGNAQVEIFIFENVTIPREKTTVSVAINPTFSFTTFDELLILGFYKKVGNTGWFSVPGISPDERTLLQEYVVMEYTGQLLYVVKKSNFNAVPATSQTGLFLSV